MGLGDKQHQISRGDNYNKFYLLLLFDHRGLGLGFGVQYIIAITLQHCTCTFIGFFLT